MVSRGDNSIILVWCRRWGGPAALISGRPGEGVLRGGRRRIHGGVPGGRTREVPRTRDPAARIDRLAAESADTGDRRGQRGRRRGGGLDGARLRRGGGDGFRPVPAR